MSNLKNKAMKLAFTGLAGWAASVAIHMGTGRSFPTAEETLQRMGHDPALVKKLTDYPYPIRVRDLTTNAGYVHAYLDLLWLPFDLSNITDLPDEKLPMSKYGGLAHKFRIAYIDLPGEAPTFKEELTYSYGVSPELVERDPVPGHMLKLFVLMHEFGHSKLANQGLGRIPNEAECDIAAMPEAENVFPGENISMANRYYRFLEDSANYDMALYLDARATGGKVPTDEELLKTGYNFGYVFAFLQANDPHPSERDWGKGRTNPADLEMGYKIEGAYRMLRGTDQLKPKARERFTPDVKRRAELFLEAANYYMPNFTKTVTDYADKTYNLKSAAPPTPVTQPLAELTQ